MLLGGQQQCMSPAGQHWSGWMRKPGRAGLGGVVYGGRGCVWVFGGVEAAGATWALALGQRGFCVGSGWTELGALSWGFLYFGLQTRCRGGLKCIFGLGSAGYNMDFLILVWRLDEEKEGDFF